MLSPRSSESAAMGTASNDRRTDRADRTCSRRTFVAAAGTTALGSLAGCSTVVDYVADRSLGDANVLNGTASPVSGTIAIVDPDGETVLDETFDLAASSDGNDIDADAGSVARYDDVWPEAGEYEVSIDLDEDGLNGAETVTIDDPDAERLAVGIGQAGAADVISFHVFEGVDDLEDEFA